jgi:hypothetical protein
MGHGNGQHQNDRAAKNGPEGVTARETPYMLS